MWEGEPVGVDQKRPLVGFALVAVLCAVLMTLSVGRGWGADIFRPGKPIAAPVEIRHSAVPPAEKAQAVESASVSIPAELSAQPLGVAVSAHQAKRVSRAAGTSRTQAAQPAEQDEAQAEKAAQGAADQAERSADKASDKASDKAEREAEREADKAAAKAARDAAKAAAKAERDAAKAAAKAERDAAKAAAKAERDAAKAAAKAERDAAKLARKEAHAAR
jgi:hypothetical protein